jgi:hypothetical protein
MPPGLSLTGVMNLRALANMNTIFTSKLKRSPFSRKYWQHSIFFSVPSLCRAYRLSGIEIV